MNDTILELIAMLVMYTVSILFKTYNTI